MNYVKEYIDAIEKGSIKVNRKVKKLYCEILKPIIEDKNEKYYFNEKKGERVIKFLEGFCKQRTGIYRGKNLQLMLFQKAKWQAIFGILHRSTDLRRFREIFDVRGRKNCKTTEHAGIALYLLREEAGAEVYAAASTFYQASKLWKEAKSMVAQNPELSANKKPSRGLIGHGPYNWRNGTQPEIFIQQTDSTFMPLSSNTDALDGLNSSAAVIDEVHALSREIYDLIKQSMSARQQPLLSMISTAGFIREGLYDDIYNYSLQVLDGIAEDDTIFPLIYDLDDPKQINDEEYWICANPALDIVKSRQDLRILVRRMKHDMNLENTVKVKDFNIRGVENKAWLPYDVFNKEVKYAPEQMNNLSKIVIGGFDLSRTGDLTAFTTLHFDLNNGKIIAETMYWITQDFFEKQIESSSKIPWKQWVDRGFIKISGTSAISYKDISTYVNDKFRNEGLQYSFICYDSYSAIYLVDELASLGYAKGYCLIPVRQGFQSLSIPMQRIETDLKEDRLYYQNNPVTKWCFSNVELVSDRNGNQMPKKNGDNYQRKIDGVATIINCYYGYTQNYNTITGGI